MFCPPAPAPGEVAGTWWYSMELLRLPRRVFFSMALFLSGSSTVWESRYSPPIQGCWRLRLMRALRSISAKR